MCGLKSVSDISLVTLLVSESQCGICFRSEHFGTGNFVCWSGYFTFLISNFHRVLNVVRFLLRNSPASLFYMLTFQNSLSVPSS